MQIYIYKYTTKLPLRYGGMPIALSCLYESLSKIRN